MEQAKDKYDAMALISGPIAGLKPEQLPGLAHIYRQIARDEREACARLVEQNQETYRETSSGTSRYLSARTSGNLAGLSFADAIRARTDQE